MDIIYFLTDNFNW